jgi:hypothetical protein
MKLQAKAGGLNQLHSKIQIADVMMRSGAAIGRTGRWTVPYIGPAAPRCVSGAGCLPLRAIVACPCLTSSCNKPSATIDRNPIVMH